MSARNPHYCDLDPYDADYREPDFCPGCDRVRYLQAEEAMEERHEAERQDLGW